MIKKNNANNIFFYFFKILFCFFSSSAWEKISQEWRKSMMMMIRNIFLYFLFCTFILRWELNFFFFHLTHFFRSMVINFYGNFFFSFTSSLFYFLFLSFRRFLHHEKRMERRRQHVYLLPIYIYMDILISVKFYVYTHRPTVQENAFRLVFFSTSSTWFLLLVHFSFVLIIIFFFGDRLQVIHIL